MKSYRPRGVVLVVLWAGIAATVQAAPPKIIDEDDDVRPANFADVEAAELPRTISPRSKPAETSAKTITPSKKSTGTVSLWGTVIGLGVVFTLFVGVRVWLTRHGPLGMRGLPVEALELLGKRTIEPRVSIHIVRCGPKILVLGVAPDGVRTLTEITDPVEIDMIAGACRRKETAGPATASFSGLMQQTNSRGAA